MHPYTMTEHDYQLAWGLYVVAALGCLLVGFVFTSWMWRWLREPLRVVLAVLLLTPTIVDPAKDSFAPAIAIAVLDLAFKVGNNVLRAASDLAMYGMIAFVLYGVFALIRWPWLKRRQARAEEQAKRAEQTAADEPYASTAVEPSLVADRQDRYRDTSPAPAGRRVEPRL